MQRHHLLYVSQCMINWPELCIGLLVKVSEAVGPENCLGTSKTKFIMSVKD